MCLTSLFDDTTGHRVQTHESSAPNTSFTSQTSKGIWFVHLFIFERGFDKCSADCLELRSSCLHVPRPVSLIPSPGLAQGGATLVQTATWLLLTTVCCLLQKRCFTSCPSCMLEHAWCSVPEVPRLGGWRQKDQKFSHLWLYSKERKKDLASHVAISTSLGNEWQASGEERPPMGAEPRRAFDNISYFFKWLKGCECLKTPPPHWNFVTYI